MKTIRDICKVVVVIAVIVMVAGWFAQWNDPNIKSIFFHTCELFIGASVILSFITTFIED